MMLVKLAWRNIWRNKLRSLVVVISIGLGIWALLFLLSFNQGMIQNYIEDGINTQTSHLQVHNPKFIADKELKYFIENPENVSNALASDPAIDKFSSRILSTGMVASSKNGLGVNIMGIDVEAEKKISNLSERLIDGSYLPEGKKNAILIGAKTAEKLGVKIKSKVVLTFQDVNQEITSAAFRVFGIYETNNAKFDETNVFVRKKDLARLTNLPESTVHEFAVLVNDLSIIEETTQALQEKFPAQLVESYTTLSPDLALFESQSKLSLIIMTTIFMLALIFGIINTMLMAVLERMKELGMLMAIGMNKTKVFFMIVLETIMLAMIGGPIGMILAWLTIVMVGDKGFDLSAWGDGMKEFGIATIIYPTLSFSSYLVVGFAIMLTAVIASIYPARKAVKLKPVQALRTI